MSLGFMRQPTLDLLITGLGSGIGILAIGVKSFSLSSSLSIGTWSKTDSSVKEVCGTQFKGGRIPSYGFNWST